MQRAEVIERLRDYFARHGAAYAAAYLYGSVARDTGGPKSDVDVAVIQAATPASSPAVELSLEGPLERILHMPVQVIDLERAPVDLTHRVLRDGVLVHEGDRRKRIRTEMLVRARYFDLRPILDEYRRTPRKRIRSEAGSA